MKDFLSNKCDSDLICDIEQVILATKYPPSPQTLIERIICDADTYHFGTGDFQITDPLVKKEIETRNGKVVPNWMEQSLRMLETHSFHTGYCQHKLRNGKLINIMALREQIYKGG